ncbi:hypothetical protein JTB14_018276 [Gonioctena quinquepunctata]|nr:hypothetical protein JTB14_018276 [Gonioctena quinquepunctata]
MSLLQYSIKTQTMLIISNNIVTVIGGDNSNGSQHKSESNRDSDRDERIPLALFAKRTKTVWDAFKEIEQNPNPKRDSSNHTSEYERQLNMEVDI